VPFAVDKGINCGMRMVRSDLPASACTERMLDALYTELQRQVPIQPNKDTLLSKKEVRRALTEGAGWARQRFELPDSELDGIERRGSMFTGMNVDPDEVLAAVPDPALKKARRAMGSLGAGNHFLEAQEIVEILDPEKARLLGLEKGNVLFMMHTGSGAVGGLTMRYYSTHGRIEERGERLRFDLAKLRFHLRHARLSGQDFGLIAKYMFAHRKFFTIPADSYQGRRFVHAVYAASNFGYVNRMAITEALRNSVRTTFGDPNLTMPLLYDCSHVTIQQEMHHGEPVWVHRHGANAALPPSRCQDHPVFSRTGQPIPVPGSMGSDSYIGVGVEGNAATYCSANHGAGRTLDKPQAMAQFTEQSVEAEMAARQIRPVPRRHDEHRRAGAGFLQGHSRRHRGHESGCRSPNRWCGCGRWRRSKASQHAARSAACFQVRPPRTVRRWSSSANPLRVQRFRRAGFRAQGRVDPFALDGAGVRRSRSRAAHLVAGDRAGGEPRLRSASRDAGGFAVACSELG
jgi:tRNA-splicing ligase RtcB